jgi:hypothetical protein
MLNNQTFLKIAAAVMAAVVAVLLGLSVLKQKETRSVSAFPGDDSELNTTTNSDGDGDDGSPATLADLSLGSFGATNTDANNGDSADESEDGSSDNQAQESGRKGLTLRIGVIGSTPDRDEVTTINELPTRESVVRRAYNQAESRACRMLIPDVSVSPPRSTPPIGQAGTYGRLASLTIGLELSSQGSSKLPPTVVKQVQRYFADHRLSIQPVLYYDKDGNLYFGTDCQAGFFKIDSPYLTVEPEPMIASAVSRFRALGVVGSRDESPVEVESQSTLGRTLAMAFQFERAATTTAFASKRSRFATELMLLHIPAGTKVQDPKVQLFITSDDRKTLHRLNTSGERLRSPIPTISATVRFEKTVLMGLYPSSPVVTDINYRSEGVVSIDSIVRMTKPSDDEDSTVQTMTVTEVLDQFGAGLSQDSLMVEGRRSVLDRAVRDRTGRKSGEKDPMLEAGLLNREKMMTGLAK